MEKLINDFSVGLFFWQSLLFIALILLLKKFAWGPILTAVEEREDGITDALEAAEKAKAEMQALNADNERILAEARIERDALLKEAREIKEGIVFYHIPPKSRFHFESSRWVDIQNEYNKRNSLQKDFVNNFSKVIDQQQGMAEVSEDEMDEDIVRNAPIQMASKSFNTLWCKIELEARTSITHFEREFRKAKEQDGGTFYYLTPGENDVQQIKDIW